MVQKRTVPGLIADFALQNPRAHCLAGDGMKTLDYGGLFRLVSETASGLRAAGIGRNDAVLLLLPDGPLLAAAFVAVSAAAIAAPLNPACPLHELESVASRLRPKAVLVDADRSPQRAEMARKLGLPILELQPLDDGRAGSFRLKTSDAARLEPCPLPSPDDPAFVLHSGGSTGTPKLALNTHSNAWYATESVRQSVRLGPGERCLSLLPLYHSAGLIIAVFSSMATGASVFCSPGFQAPRFFDWMAQYDPTWCVAAPAMYQQILPRAVGNPAARRHRLRLLRSAAAAMPIPLLERLEQTFGIPVLVPYGAAETCTLICTNLLDARKKGSVGRPLGADIAIVDPRGNRLPAGIEGEIVVRGPSVMREYANDPDATREAFLDGWYRMGDLGFFDEDGFLFVTGRLKEMINRGGQKVSPREVENVLLRHPAVIDAAVFPIPDERLGEEVGAAVVTQGHPQVTELQLREFVAQSLAAYKVPRHVVLASEIPRTAAGKLRRGDLAGHFGLSGQPASGRPDFVAPGTPLEETIAGLWAETLGAERIGVFDNFFELGGDSMGASLLVSRVCGACAVEVTMLDLFDTPTVAAQALLVLEKQLASAPAADVERAFAEIEAESFSAVEPMPRSAAADGSGSPRQ